ncbi:MAG: T9SS type A sorting domain-containing protein, partial [Bacteroidales bacterium]
TYYSGNVEYNIYRDDQKVSTVYGFSNTSHVEEMPDCSDYEYTVTASFPDVNMESEKTNATQISSCYSVLFMVETENGDPVDEAEVTFNDETNLTNAEGEVVFNNVPKGTDQPYTITSEYYEEENDSTDVAEDTTINVTLKGLNPTFNSTWTKNISFSPNPVTGQGTLEGLPFDQWTINVYDMTGRKISERNFKGGESIKWDFSGYLPGTYMMVVRSQEGKTIRLKIVKTGQPE